MRHCIIGFVSALLFFSCASENKKADAADQSVPASVASLAAPATGGGFRRSTRKPTGSLESLEQLTPAQRKIRQDWTLKWLTYFTKKDSSRFQRHLDRAEPYRPLVERIFEEYGVPADLFYLGVIESGFVIHAKSHASAVGVWQFIEGTATRYGMDVNSYVDERRDPLRATVAAAKYLRDLHNVFHSWPLAMAAYNAGEGRVLRAVMRGKTRNFWELAEKGMLPSETANYVPKILAAMSISQNRARFGFREAPSQMFPDLKLVEVPSGVSLHTLARQAQVSVEDLKTYNPHLLKDMTPPGKGNHGVWVLENSAESVRKAAVEVPQSVSSFKPQVAANTRAAPARPASAAAKRSVQATRAPAPKPAPKSSPTKLVYVKSGDTLIDIAKTHGTTVDEVKRLNHLKSTRLLVGQSLRVPGAGTSYRPKSTVQYRVRPGDNLHRIAKKFGQSVDEIRALNSLDRSNLYAGEVLKIEKSGI